jgi:hypothetical protein
MSNFDYGTLILTITYTVVEYFISINYFVGDLGLNYSNPRFLIFWGFTTIPAMLIYWIYLMYKKDCTKENHELMKKSYELYE